MSTTMNTDTRTLLDLLKEWKKVEIPVIQRNYVQGSNTRIRAAFVRYLIDALIAHRRIELDFVYGAEQRNGQANENDNNSDNKVFIPLDGQQRLTTVWLLHCYLLPTASAEQKDAFSEVLQRFVYETRPSAKDFCRYLLEAYKACKDCNSPLLTAPSKYIKNKSWFDPEWKKEATVVAMLGMLDEFAQHRDRLLEAGVSFSALSDERLISFFHLAIEKFGLTNDLYIRMNARGEQLTDFEHFKSTLYKALGNYDGLSDIKDKMEHHWVDLLWEYRKEGEYVIDAPFMNFLSFVNEVTDIKLYKQNEGKKEDYKVLPSYTEIGFVEKLYEEHSTEAADRLVAYLDGIEQLKKIDYAGIFRKDDVFVSFQDGILKKVMQRKLESTDERILLYSALAFVAKFEGTAEELNAAIVPFLRVIRNLSVNTDKQMRDLQQIYSTVDHLVENTLGQQRDIYTYLSTLAAASVRLSGFSPIAQAEEEWKANLRIERSEFASLLDEMEDYFQGEIGFVLYALLDIDDEGKPRDWTKAEVNKLDFELLRKVFEAYKRLKKNPGLGTIRGDLFLTGVYYYNPWISRVVIHKKWQRLQPLFQWIMAYVKSGLELKDYCKQYERVQLKRLVEGYYKDHEDERLKADAEGYWDALTKIRDPQQQLFIYYVITRRVMHKNENEFFGKGDNFGWLEKKEGYASLFTKGIKDCQWFSETSPTFQSYGGRFHHKKGVKRNAALPPEKEGREKLEQYFQKLQHWVAERS